MSAYMRDAAARPTLREALEAANTEAQIDAVIVYARRRESEIDARRHVNRIADLWDEDVGDDLTVEPPVSGAKMRSMR